MKTDQIERERYKNRSGTSGVTYYAPGPDWICVWFDNGRAYVYDRNRPGPQHVEEMKSRAAQGKGLATYINQHVRANYARKL